jgi:REP element-mobilizing transposase RayT
VLIAVTPYTVFEVMIMTRLPRVKSETGIYHVVMRGINKQQLFEEDEDYSKLLDLLRNYKEQISFEIYAYCLMGNHFHLLIKEGKEDVGHIMKRIGASFVYWYNWKYQRSGHLFQDRFKSEPVETDAYLVTVIRYIHQNPVVAGLCALPKQYPYSSYKDYLDLETESLIDRERVFELVDRQDIVSKKLDEQSSCLEVDLSTRLTDKDARNLIQQISGCKSAADVQSLDVESRKLLAHNNSVAQIYDTRRIRHKAGLTLGVPKTPAA